MATKKKTELVNNEEAAKEENASKEEGKKEIKKRKVSAKTEKLNGITFEFMIDYISKNAPDDKQWFKDNAFDDGKYQHLIARKKFVERYMPELKAEKKISKWEQLKNW